MDSQEPLYFASPKEAVARIVELLASEDFAALSRYYYLADSDVDLEEVASGRFYSRRKHPFSTTGFRYSSCRETKPGLWQAHVAYSPKEEQGLGSYHEFFLLRKTDEGYQLLPDACSDDPLGGEDSDPWNDDIL